jgi:hypothetical protein
MQGHVDELEGPDLQVDLEAPDDLVVLLAFRARLVPVDTPRRATGQSCRSAPRPTLSHRGHKDASLYRCRRSLTKIRALLYCGRLIWDLPRPSHPPVGPKGPPTPPAARPTIGEPREFADNRHREPVFDGPKRMLTSTFVLVRSCRRGDLNP